MSSAWLKENFSHCPQGAPQELVERHAPSRSTMRTGSRAASMGKAIQTPQESKESDAQCGSGEEDPDFEVIGM